MIVINKSQSNTVYIQAYDNQTLTNPYYLFEFTNKVEKTPIYAIIAETSQYPERTLKFVITEGTTVTLTEEGEWSYRLFEQSSASNTNPSLATKLIYEGDLYVVGTPTLTKREYVLTTTIKTYGAGA